MTGNNTNDRVMAFAQVDSSRKEYQSRKDGKSLEEYKQALDDLHWTLIREMFIAVSAEHWTLKAATVRWPSWSKKEALIWLGRFADAQMSARHLVEVALWRKAVYMPIFHAQIADLVTVYLVDPVLVRFADGDDDEQLAKILESRVSAARGVSTSVDVDELEVEYQEFLHMGDPGLSWQKQSTPLSDISGLWSHPEVSPSAQGPHLYTEQTCIVEEINQGLKGLEGLSHAEREQLFYETFGVTGHRAWSLSCNNGDYDTLWTAMVVYEVGAAARAAQFNEYSGSE